MSLNAKIIMNVLIACSLQMVWTGQVPSPRLFGIIVLLSIVCTAAHLYWTVRRTVRQIEAEAMKVLDRDLARIKKTKDRNLARTKERENKP